MPLTSIDVRILNCLVENPDANYKDISKKLSISSQTVYNRLNSMKTEKILEGLIPKINLEKAGYLTKAIILFNTDLKEKSSLIKTLSNRHNIVSILEVSGPFNVALIACLKSTKELHSLVKELSENDMVSEVETHIVYNTFKDSVIPFPLAEK
ncbi:MAG: Lrp/AsnC family transcriptional regulator [archaeon]